MIFSLLKIRKKTSAVIAGIFIGAACLWGVAMWQEIPPREIAIIFMGSMIFIFGIILIAFLVVLLLKLVGRIINRSNIDSE